MKIIGILLGMLFLGSIATVGIRLLFFPVNVTNKYIDTASGAVNKTLNADNAIYNYEWFKQTYEDIEATKSKLDNASIAVDSFAELAGGRSDWTFEDKTEYNRLNAVKLGLQNHLEQIIANYNARAKMANRNIFQNSILPGFVDSFTFIKK